ncbi:MAG: DUF502 domain-containing protein [SAR202 cluster bacterium]|nr:DUF502 domain-containing protein [SAR202 cluster bacterium]
MDASRGPSDNSRNGPTPGQILSPIARLQRHAGRRIVSGFLILVPLIITFLILRFVYMYVEGFFSPVVDEFGWTFPGIGVLITLVLLYITGAFLAGKRVRAWEDSLLSRIPILGSIYSVSRQSIDALSSTTGQHFSRVVFLDWPRPGVRAMGFVTGYLDSGIDGSGAMVVVYIPTVPNPTSGMLAWVPEDDVISTDITVEDAMKAVFSGGIVLPSLEVPANIPDAIPL